MKDSEYTEGPEATRNFEDAMKAIFKAPKPPKKLKGEAGESVTTLRKKPRPDKD